MNLPYVKWIATFYIFSAVNLAFGNQYNTQDALNSLKTFKANDVPGFVTDSPPETNLNNYNALEAAIQRDALKSEAAQLIQESAEKRPYFQIDPVKDPIVANSLEAIQDPQLFLSKGTYTNRSPLYHEIKTCEEAKAASTYSCTKTLIEPSIHIEPAKYSHYWCAVGIHRPDDSSCQAKTYYATARKYKDEVVTVTKEEWTNNCATLEKRAQQGLCKHIVKICPKGAETRDIVATVSGEGKPTVRPITRDCWHYKLEFQCTYPAQNNCEVLRQASCEQVNSECIKHVGDACVVWQQTFKCPKGQRYETETIKVDNLIPQIPDSSAGMAYANNNEFGDAMAKLSVLNEVQENLRQSNNNDALPEIFKGKALSCRKAAVGFSDCCKFKGWGQSLHLTDCDAESKELAEREPKGLCVEIGTFKKGKAPLKQKRKGYCCFPTKLARILHQQGRSQLGISWGDPKDPQCRGYSVDELSRLNFDHLNLSELYADIQARVKLKDPEVVKRNLSGRISQISSSLKNQPVQGEY